MAARIMLVLLSLIALGACGTPGAASNSAAHGNIAISDAWVRPMEGVGAMDHSSADAAHAQPTGAAMDTSGFSSAAYMTIRNTGSAADRLLKASTDAATSVELHNSANTNGVMSMSDVPAVDVAAGGTVEFKPGGLHMMLVGLKHDLKAGDTVALSLQFEHAGTITVNAAVRDQ